MGVFTPTGGTPSNPFFGAVDQVFDQAVTSFSSGFGDGLRQAVPVWTQNLLGQQTSDQFQREMFSLANSPTPVSAEKVDFEVGTSGNIKIDSKTALLMGGSILALIVALRFIR